MVSTCVRNEIDLLFENSWPDEFNSDDIVGWPMELKGLIKNPELNGQAGVVVGVQRSGPSRGEWRIMVQLPDELGGDVVRVRPDCVTSLSQGQFVELVGLESRPELNGKTFKVSEYDSENKKYTVLGDDLSLKVRPSKMKPRVPVWKMDLGDHKMWLTWRGEQEGLTFIDSQHHHRSFSLHLPLDMHRFLDGQVPPFPLILFMPGSGGGHLFRHSKKSLKSNGSQYAAQSFVIVAPVCGWTWKQSAEPWVLELVQFFRRASWVSEKQVYITGVSMGGMSTWEIAAKAPELFAAVAPVAAHHKEDERCFIAEQLQGKPIHAFHSSIDSTCPMLKEELLWNEIEARGTKVRKTIFDDVDHCSVHDSTYCANAGLFQWMLGKHL